MHRLKIGDKLPEFSLQNQDGETINIADHIGIPVVIFFYPKDDTPGCSIEACAFRDDFHKFSIAGVKLFGISSDGVTSHKKFIQKYNLPYDLLSDPNDRIRKLLGVPSGLLGLLPGRVTYIIDSKGTITHIFSDQLNFKKHVKEAIMEIEKFEDRSEHLRHGE